MRYFHLQLYNLACIFRRFLSDNCLSRAAELTFTTLLAIVPLMMVALVVFTIFPQFAVLGDKAQNFIFAHFVPSTGEVIQTQLNLWVKKTVQLSWLGIISLLVTAIFVLFSIENAFNAIWRIKKSRHFIEGFFLYWGILTLAPLLLGTCILSLSYVVSWVGLTSSDSTIAEKYFTSGIVFILSALWFSLLYRLLPNRLSPFKYCLTAGIVAALLLELARQGFAFYIDRFSIYTLVYGALAAIPIFLLWLYLSWVIVLWGAELLQILPYWRTSLAQRQQSTLSRALRLLKMLHDNHHSYNYDIWLKEAPPDEFQDSRTLEERLEKAGIIACFNKKIKLTVDLNQLTLYDLMEALYYPGIQSDIQHLENQAISASLEKGLDDLKVDWGIAVGRSI